ncbi:GNAT family N-acetyltransferase [Bacillus sp. EB106-08-02-XG196]|jgi:ribosomal protein S18 acetylase RimI-like enzyme|uniref:GNAT family N-acetyltransferase n=1 Tax=Bacillus sp. EB106-08-02-XG196 TaxID=2737049 RepID=UPI0015C4B2EA|nr:GNAT family N-acetyltransferase [Bacillus sp. EB106-08-02-XG196]NWQ42606.1 GNAT family N-acetyltransferase [Bacillus sp. EB106-08-02-XG196]
MEVLSMLKFEELKSIETHIDSLSELLVKVVDGGASIGFLPPMKLSDARKYWQTVLKPDTILFIAKINNEIVGTIQLHLCTKQNGLHRAEIAKLMTGPYARRKGVARSLMKIAEEKAIIEGRTLLVLDTREGDPSNFLYQSLGYIQAGKIPNFALSGKGDLDTTVLYYKILN